MREGQERVDRLEERRRHLDGERAARTAYLHDQQYHRERFADIAKRNGKGVDDIGKHQARDPCRQDELERMDALNAEEQNVAQAHERCLTQCEHAKEHVASQINLVQAERL